MKPGRHHFVLHGIANGGFIALRNRNRCPVGVKQHEKLAFRPGLNGLAKHAGGISGANGLHIGQKAIADGLQLFGGDVDMMFLFHTHEMGSLANISRAASAPHLAKTLNLAFIDAWLIQLVKNSGVLR